MADVGSRDGPGTGIQLVADNNQLALWTDCTTDAITTVVTDGTRVDYLLLIPELLTQDEFRRQLYTRFESSGVLRSLKAQLRSQLLRSVGGARDTAKPAVAGG